MKIRIFSKFECLGSGKNLWQCLGVLRAKMAVFVCEAIEGLYRVDLTKKAGLEWAHTSGRWKRFTHAHQGISAESKLTGSL